MPDYSQFPNANLWRRLAAMGYDIFLLTGLSFAFGICALMLRSAVFSSPQSELEQPGIIFQVSWLILLVGFYLYFWLKGGQTLGMRAWQLKLINDTDENISFRQGTSGSHPSVNPTVYTVLDL